MSLAPEIVDLVEDERRRIGPSRTHAQSFHALVRAVHLHLADETPNTKLLLLQVLAAECGNVEAWSRLKEGTVGMVESDSEENEPGDEP